MREFFMKNAAALILAGIGVFFIIMTYGALHASRKSGHFVSGVPLVGGFCVFIGFMLSSCKWLCLLALLDYGVWMIPCSALRSSRRKKRFGRLTSEHGLSAEKTIRQDKSISLSFKDENRLYSCAWNYVFELDWLGLCFELCSDSAGESFIAVMKENEASPRLLPFPEEGVTVECKRSGEPVEVTIKLVDSAAVSE